MAQVNMPYVTQAPKEDALGTLVKGLQIAQGIYGIRTDMATLDKYKQEEQARQKALDAETRRSQGQYNPNEILSLREKFNVSPTNNQGDANYDPNAMKVTDASSGSPLYLSTKRDLKEVTTVDDKGNKITKFVYASPGTVIPAYQEPKEYETTGPSGQPMITAQVLKPGTSIPKYMPAVLTDQIDPVTGKPIQKFETAIAGKSFNSSKGMLTASEFGSKAQEEGNKLYDASKPYIDTLNAAKDIDNLLVQASQANEPAQKAAYMKLAAETMKGTPRSPVFSEEFGTPEQVSERFFKATGLAAEGRLTPKMLEDLKATAETLAMNSQTQLEKLTDTSVHRFTMNFNGAYGSNADLEAFAKNLEDNRKRLTGVMDANAVHEKNNPPPPPADPLLTALQKKAKAGDKKAQDYLNSLKTPPSQPPTVGSVP